MYAPWARLRYLSLDGRCRERGQNLFLELDGGNYCELFEDFSGDAITGCVFFEVGLLVYRSAPARFDEYFRARFSLAQGVHEQACTILDSTQDHDHKIARLQEFYATFAAVTDPHHPDSELATMVEEVIESSSSGIAHLNVLEDYYEIQQDKVRTLIGILKLPIRLVTVHFNAHTGTSCSRRRIGSGARRGLRHDVRALMSTTDNGQITVMTWNLWGRSRDWIARATAIDATLTRFQPDVLAVQEAWSTPRCGDQVAALAHRHGYHHLAHRDPAGPDRGIGLMSRWPLVTTAVVALPAGHAPSEHRTALVAEVDSPVGPRPFCVTHLNWRPDHGPIRRAQLATIARHLAESTRAVVCSDLNAEPDSGEIQMMTGLTAPAAPGVVFEDAWVAAGATGAGHTWTNRNPYAAAERLGDARLDYILVRLTGEARGAVIDAEVVDGNHNGTWGSDHSALLTTLDLS